MKLNKYLNKLYAGIAVLCSTLSFTACEADLTYEEAPESYYSQVGISGITISAREWFVDQMYAVNWNKWVDNYISTVTVGGTGSFSWTNNTNAAITVNGKSVAPGETVTVTSSTTTESCSEAPDGTLYVYNMYVTDHAIYNTPNKGYLFDKNKFSGEFQLLDHNGTAYVNAAGSQSRYVRMPIRKNELVGVITLVDRNNCTVEPVNGAPTLGEPGDFTASAQRYLVKNICYLPAGVEQYQRLYEFRITYLPGSRN